MCYSILTSLLSSLGFKSFTICCWARNWMLKSKWKCLNKYVHIWYLIWPDTPWLLLLIVSTIRCARFCGDGRTDVNQGRDKDTSTMALSTHLLLKSTMCWPQWGSNLQPYDSETNSFRYYTANMCPNIYLSFWNVKLNNSISIFLFINSALTSRTSDGEQTRTSPCAGCLKSCSRKWKRRYM